MSLRTWLVAAERMRNWPRSMDSGRDEGRSNRPRAPSYETLRGRVTADPTWAKLVRTLVDGFQCVADVVGQGVFGCERVAAGVDLDGAVAA
jgi:hypothetical protein